LKKNLKSIIAVFVILILIITIFTVGTRIDLSEEIIFDEEESNKSQNDNTNKEENTNEEEKDDNLTEIIDTDHIVFVEEATATWCSNCPDVAESLHELYDPNNPDFYYVSLVVDGYDNAKNRLKDDYNVLGYPTVYIDGGYETIMGSSNFKSVFINKLSKAKQRDYPNIYLNITSEYNESRNEIKNEVILSNYEDNSYSGELKVYITEIVSSYNGWDGKPFSYAFIDYGLEENILLGSMENKTFSGIWDVPDDVYKENLFIIAVLFNSDKNKAFSNPSDQENEYDAYYADASIGTRVSEGKLPPSIGISSPKDFSHYIFGKEKKNKLFQKTYIIGRTTLESNVEAESGVEKVEYTIKGRFREIKETITSEPYNYEWKKPSFGKYTITAKIYDKDGRTNIDSIEVYAFMIGFP